MNFLELRVGNMRIYLGGGNIGMPEQALHAAQVGTIAQQVGRKAMTQRVRRNMLGNAGFGAIALDNALNGARRQAANGGVLAILTLAGLHK